MIAAETSANEQEILLIVESDKKRAVFSFEPGSESTILFGSVPNSHFRLAMASPLAFYVERRRGDLVLVPAYVDTAIRFNTQKLSDWTVLPDRSIVEVAGHRLILTNRNLPPTVPPPPNRRPLDDEYDPDTAAVTAVHQYEECLATLAVDAARGDSVHDIATVAIEGAPELAASLLDAEKTKFMGSLQEFEADYPGLGPVDQSPQESTSITGSGFGTSAADECTLGVPLDDFLPPSRSQERIPAVGVVQPDFDEVPRDGVPSELAHRETVASQPTPRATREAVSKVAANVRAQIERLGAYAKHKPVHTVVATLGAGALIALLVAAVTVVSRDRSELVASANGADQSIVPVPEPASLAAEPAVGAAKAERAVSGTLATGTSSMAPSPSVASARAEIQDNAKPGVTQSKPLSREERAALKAEEARQEAEEAAARAAIDQAVRHMIAGRYDEASGAYRELARVHPDSPALERMATLMDRHRNISTTDATHQVLAPDIYP